MRTQSICFAMISLAALTSALAQPGVWNEVGDAPEGVLNDEWQVTVGNGTLTEIRGSLDRAAGDHVDTYSFIIDEPMTFYASTADHLGGSLPNDPMEKLINTRMSLWSASTLAEITAEIVLGNDDDAFPGAPGVPPGGLASTISNPASFALLTTGTANTMIELQQGLYLLSITTFDNDPEDAMGNDLVAYNPGDLTALYGPNSMAGPFDHWENASSSDFGSYVIALQGAAFAAADVLGDFNGDGLWNCLDVDALVAEVASGTNNPSFDLNGDSLVDSSDVAEWLVVGGAHNAGVTGGNPFLPGDANLNGFVDGADFGIWNAAKFTAQAAWCGGDFTVDGTIDGADFGVWNVHKFTSSNRLGDRAGTDLPRTVLPNGRGAATCAAYEAQGAMMGSAWACPSDIRKIRWHKAAVGLG